MESNLTVVFWVGIAVIGFCISLSISSSDNHQPFNDFDNFDE